MEKQSHGATDGVAADQALAFEVVDCLKGQLHGRAAFSIAFVISTVWTLSVVTRRSRSTANLAPTKAVEVDIC